ncbi:ABC-ATPase domain-containing protein [Thermosyntropha sp.]|uniref:ABC-ATPase domain-containing protein n=1 Tax=Thermosyntropha sp. TaxID=2740820 RepID=UPI0025FF10AB|nr:ABC-ATPase domain-containing protein [Thermosyntropha sp.]MBO8158436.1 ABC-ATPase domain-containing protein [Thermosyntropha sp.]
MRNVTDLKMILDKIDGRGYKAYKTLEGSYDLKICHLYIDHVQADPFAPPSRMRIRVPMDRAGFPYYLYEGIKVTALEDIIARIIKSELMKSNLKSEGAGNSGLIFIDAGGQEIIKRTAVKITSEMVEARISVGLPAAGRRIKGDAAINLLTSIIPQIASNSLYFKALDEKKLKEHVELYADQELIRNKLKELGLVAFIGNGSILPRKSGNSNLPMSEKEAVKFLSPPSMEIEIDTMFHGKIKGMGIKEGITLIVGGGFHGKTTLLRALERGVYNHIKGDGREWVITVPDAVKIRAEDGRNIEKVDISIFIDNLPFNKSTDSFSTENASGSTSQAANIIEAVEAGAKLLLLDEDTSATNFMLRDARMQKLVAKNKEPITPFIDRVRELYEKLGISTILVIGGAGDYLDVADKVIMLDSYKVYDVTDEAHEIAAEIPSNRKIESVKPFKLRTARIVKKETFAMKDKKLKVAAKGLDTIVYGKTVIDLSAVEQLVDSGQTRAIADILRYIVRYIDEKSSLKEILDKIDTDILSDLEVISPFPKGEHPGDLVLPRRYEVASALNRMRNLKIK